MFVTAVEKVSKYTRQVQSIMRSYGSQRVTAGSSTLFFVNDNGDAITCRHVAELIVNADQISKQYALFTQSRFRLKNDSTFDQNLNELEEQYNYKDILKLTSQLMHKKTYFISIYFFPGF